MKNIFGVPGYGLLIHSRRRFGSSHLEPLSAERRSTRSSQRKWLSSPSVSGCLSSRRSGDCQTKKNFPGHVGFLEGIIHDYHIFSFLEWPHMREYLIFKHTHATSGLQVAESEIIQSRRSQRVDH